MAAKHKREFKKGIKSIGLRVRGVGSEFKNRTDARTVIGGDGKWIWSGPDVRVWFLSFIILMGSCNGYQEQRFAMEPQDQVISSISKSLFVYI